MHDDWLMSVLREIKDYAVTHNLTAVMPLVEAGYLAAEKELDLSTPIRFEASRMTIGTIAAEAAHSQIAPSKGVTFPTARTH